MTSTKLHLNGSTLHICPYQYLVIITYLFFVSWLCRSQKFEDPAEGEDVLVAKFKKLHDDLIAGFRNLEDETRWMPCDTHIFGSLGSIHEAKSEFFSCISILHQSGLGFRCMHLVHNPGRTGELRRNRRRNSACLAVLHFVLAFSVCSLMSPLFCR